MDLATTWVTEESRRLAITCSCAHRTSETVLSKSFRRTSVFTSANHHERLATTVKKPLIPHFCRLSQLSSGPTARGSLWKRAIERRLGCRDFHQFFHVCTKSLRSSIFGAALRPPEIQAPTGAGRPTLESRVERF